MCIRDSPPHPPSRQTWRAGPRPRWTACCRPSRRPRHRRRPPAPSSFCRRSRRWTWGSAAALGP
eukprot:1414690-Alexandrium_andersonii.AAC.1